MSGIGRGEWQKQIVAKRGNRGNGGRSCEDNRADACCRGEETRESVCVSLRTCHASGFANSCPVSHLSTSGRKRGRRSYIHAYIEENRRFGRRQFVFLAARSAERRGIP